MLNAVHCCHRLPDFLLVSALRCNMTELVTKKKDLSTSPIRIYIRLSWVMPLLSQCSSPLWVPGTNSRNDLCSPSLRWSWDWSLFPAIAELWSPHCSYWLWNASIICVCNPCGKPSTCPLGNFFLLAEDDVPLRWSREEVLVNLEQILGEKWLDLERLAWWN